MLWNCVHCGKKMKVPDSLLGKRGKCPQCKKVIDFPEAAPTVKMTAAAVLDRPKWSRRRLIDLALCASGAVLFHIVAVLLFLTMSSGSAPGEGPKEEEVTFATLPPTEELVNNDNQKFDEKAVPDNAASDDFTPTQPTDASPAMAGGSDLGGAELAGPSFATTSSGGADLGPVFGGAGGGGKGGGGASFMGSRSKGREGRICIICDRSGSMGGAKMEFTKTKLMDTLRKMRPGTKFFVVFFDDVPEAQPGGKWLTAPQDVSKLGPWTESIFARGSTEPGPAFKLAFSVKPRPDIIFFMTDGVFNPEYIEAIKKMNTPGATGKKTTINTIALLDRAGERLLKQIAEENLGTYTYVRNFRGEN